MKELYELKDLVCDELKEYGRKGEITAGSLDVIDKLSHTLKSLETVIAMEEAGEYSNDYYPMTRGNSYARGRKRDSMGRYSRTGYSRDNADMVERLREIMEEAPNEAIKADIRKIVNKIE